MQVSVDGFCAEVIVDYDPGQPTPSYSCGGVPPSMNIEIGEVWLEDADAFHSSCTWERLMDEQQWSSGLCQMLESFASLMGKLHPKVEALALNSLISSIEDEAAEAFRNYEPDDYDDYEDYDDE